jgi:5-methylcytosine-specific restriction endonuclease McrA
MTEVLVLNAGFVPIELISARESIVLLYTNKAYSVVESDKVMRSPSISIKIPTVISLLTYKHIPKKKVSFSKLAVIYRDDCTCMYCGKQFSVKDLTVDHIIPKSRWQEVKRTSKRNWTNWTNCVCSCRWCNNKKGKLLLEEAHMQLIREPFEPKYAPHIVISRQKATSNGWLPFCNITVKIVDLL